jgi:tetratricopeptide (TPR) repeat protein
MENALSGAKLSYVIDEPKGKVSYTLTDGVGEALVAMSMAAEIDQNQKTTQAVAVQNPYPEISLYLGSYYNEVNQPADALRILDIGLSLSAVSGLDLGEHRADLIAERGAALSGLQRWSDMLTDYDDGLKIDDLDRLMRARMDRGRGYALTELGRLDEAESAYNESLKNEPDNAHALSELSYIARLRTGASPTANTLVHVLPPPSNNSNSGASSSH